MKRDIDLRSRSGLGKLTRRVHRFWRANTELPSSSVALEDEPLGTSCISHREVENALLIAEQRKAEALMVQRRRVVC